MAASSVAEAADRGRCVVLLTGRKRSGKDTVAEHLCKHYGFEASLSLAEPVKLVAREIVRSVFDVDIPAEEFSNNRKEEPVYDAYGEGFLYVAGQKLTPRWAAQWVGQTLGREIIGPAVWIHALMERLVGYNRAVVTDARYRNEIDFFTRELPKLGYTVIVVKTVDTSFVRPIDPALDHPSERDADSNPCDIELRRDIRTTTRSQFLTQFDEAAKRFGVFA